MSKGSLFRENWTRPKSERIKLKTDEALNVLFPDPESLLIEVQEYQNAIEQRLMIIYGKQGSGKSETIRWIVEKAAEKYGIENINAVSTIADIEALLDEGFSDRLVNILICEDATEAISTKKDVKNKFFRVRHIMKEITGRNTGLVVVIITVHRFHSIPPAYRTDVDLLLFKNAPTNPYDNDIIRKFVGEKGIKILERVEKKRFKDIKYKGYGVFYAAGEVGKWKNSLSSVNLVKELHIEKEIPKITVDTEHLVAVEDAVYEDPVFFNKVITKLAGYVNSRDIQHFLDWLSGEPQRAIAFRAGIAQSTLSERLSNIRQNALGYAGEDAYEEYLRTQGLEFVRGGKNTDDPDFIVHTKREVISFKTYADPKLNLKHAIKSIGKKEIEYARRNKYALILLMFEMFTKKFHRYVVSEKSFSPVNPSLPAASGAVLGVGAGDSSRGCGELDVVNAGVGAGVGAGAKIEKIEKIEKKKASKAEAKVAMMAMKKMKRVEKAAAGGVDRRGRKEE
ncbi:MAG: hypothetical protein J7L47_03175 [Candidatus Odinarchaeota archaeon]|nr:hypothetical protein [Candidatus Odinarchaeota archaeon]